MDTLALLRLSFNENRDQVIVSFLRNAFKLLILVNTKNNSLTSLFSSINAFVKLSSVFFFTSVQPTMP